MLEINYKKVKNEGQQTQSLTLNAKRAYSDVYYVKNAVSSRIQRRKNISNRLNQLKYSIDSVEDDVNELANFLFFAANKYHDCDLDLVKKISYFKYLGLIAISGRFDMPHFWHDIGERIKIGNSHIVNDQVPRALWWMYDDVNILGIHAEGVGLGYWRTNGELNRNGFCVGLDVGLATVVLKDTPDEHTAINLGNLSLEAGGEVTKGHTEFDLLDKDKEESNEAKELATIMGIGLSASAEASIIDIEKSIKGKYGEASGYVTVGKAEAHASVEAGLYVYDKNGNQILAPSITAEVGASITAFEAGAEGMIGDEMLGAHGDVQVVAGKAEAKAKGTVTFIDENGNLDVQAHVKASAEAVAFEVEGKAGVTVMGVDAAVTGSFKVGVGANADVGYSDGVLKCEIGASLGVGVDLGFEVDVGGAVDAVSDVTTGIISSAGDILGDIGNFFGKIISKK